MAFKRKINTGALFKNGRKESPEHPDHQGSLNVEGVEYWLSAWEKTSRSGEPYLSIAMRLRADPEGSAPPNQPLRDDKVPF